jgi:hypothetical protein
VSAISLDAESKEGFASTLDGGVWWVDLQGKKVSSFLQGVDSGNKILRTIKVNEDMIVTIHQFGDVKVWSSQTGEILKQFKWKYAVLY